jgi:hypothetical protein
MHRGGVARRVKGRLQTLSASSAGLAANPGLDALASAWDWASINPSLRKEHTMSQSQPSQKAASLLTELHQFTGDLQRYRHQLNRRLLYTPGVRFLAESAGAYWLIDAVASWLGTPQYRAAVANDGRIDDLHFWRLTVRENHSATLAARADSDVPPFLVQKIEFTDFCMESIDLWCGFDGQHYTLYLPSEH